MSGDLVARLSAEHSLAEVSGVEPGKHGACPVCAKFAGDGGRDRFHHTKRGRWTCRHCDAAADRPGGGDVVDLLASLAGERTADYLRRLAREDATPLPEAAPVANGAPRNGTPPPKPLTTARARAELEASAERVHVYSDAEGHPLRLVTVHRAADGTKGVMQFRPLDARGDRWAPGTDEPPAEGMPFYRLPELLAVARSAPIYLVEGEGDADNGAAAGLPTFTTVGGSGSARLSDFSPLAGRTVRIIPDRDKPGERYAQDVARLALDAGAASVEILRIGGEDPPPGYDLSDLLAEAETDAAREAIVTRLAGMRGEIITPLSRWPRLRTLAQLGDVQPVRWLVPGLLPAQGLTMLYGHPGKGKSLAALRWAVDVAGDGVPVVYVVGEGFGGFRPRLEAIAQADGVPYDELARRPLVLHEGAVNLTDADEVAALLEACEDVGRVYGQRVGLVVFDTLARCALGADENSAQDAGVITAALARFQELAGAVLILHHPTKAAGNGPRGSSAFLGALDMAVEADARILRHDFTTRKVKDGGQAGQTFEYRREVVNLGEDENGDPVTGAALVATGSRAAEKGGARPPDSLTKARRATLQVFADVWGENGGNPVGAVEITRRAAKHHDRSTVFRSLKWATDGEILTGGNGDPYRPGPAWPADVLGQLSIPDEGAE